MRFQKSIQICRGVRLNVSKSGVSATVGVKGLSVNLGKKGVFLNTGIPGTGLSDRRQLFGGAKKEAAPDPRDYQLREQDGEIRVLTASGRAVSDDEARRVRRTEWFKDAQAEYNRERIQEVNAETEAVESVIRLAKRVPALGAIEPEARVEEKFDAFIGSLELPLEFSAQYSYDASTGGADQAEDDCRKARDVFQLRARAGGIVCRRRVSRQRGRSARAGFRLYAAQERAHRRAGGSICVFHRVCARGICECAL